MEKNRFLSFATSLIPGVGYMHHGLMKKGVEALAVFLLINPIFEILGLNSLGRILEVVFWCYTFFDTLSIDGRIRRGETVTDSGIFFSDDKPLDFNFKFKDENNKKFLTAAGIILVIVGTLVLLNKLFVNFDIYYIVKSYVRNYILPAILIICGVLLLFKNRNKA